MHLLTKVGVATAAVAAAALSVAIATPAVADTAALSGDAVGVGSDTAQNLADFVFDGSPGVAGGYNTAGNPNRVENVFATGDANGRAVYDGTCGTVNSATGVGAACSATAAGTPNLLAGSVVLRAGQAPVVRPNGSGAGANALIADATTGYRGLPTGSIQFARMSRLPNSTEIGNCGADQPCSGLHVYQEATDNLVMVHQTSAYNGPSGLSAAELVSIYNCSVTTWNQLPGNSGGSTATIHPLIPQSGSGTRNFFLADLATANGGTPVVPGACVRTVQEHDPTGVYVDSSPADAIEPFSQGKLSLINSGYFTNGVVAGSNGTTAYTKGYLTTLTGTPGDGKNNYNSQRGLYFVTLQKYLTSTTAFQPGSTLNFVQALLAGSTSAMQSAIGQQQIKAAGFTPAFTDCGVNPSTC